MVSPLNKLLLNPLHKLVTLLAPRWEAVRGGSPSLSYAGSGVDVGAGDSFVEAIKGCVAETHGPRVLQGLGGFGGLFDISGLPIEEPVLVAGTDGVGTKLLVSSFLYTSKRLKIVHKLKEMEKLRILMCNCDYIINLFCQMLFLFW